MHKLVNPQPYLLLNEKGIVENPGEKDLGIVLWNNIKSIALEQKQIIVELNKDVSYIRKRSKWITWILKHNQKHANVYLLKYNFVVADISVYEAYTIISDYLEKHKQLYK